MCEIRLTKLSCMAQQVGIMHFYAVAEINPLRAEIFRGNINIYLHFMSLIHIDMPQVLTILPQVRQGPTYSI